jgi:hypothetical protein
MGRGFKIVLLCCFSLLIGPTGIQLATRAASQLLWPKSLNCCMYLTQAAW